MYTNIGEIFYNRRCKNEKLLLSFIVMGSFGIMGSHEAKADTWYYPSFMGHPVTNTVECKVGYLYGPDNLKNGNCRARYDNVITNIIDTVIVGAVEGGITAIGVHSGTYIP